MSEFITIHTNFNLRTGTLKCCTKYLLLSISDIFSFASFSRFETSTNFLVGEWAQLQKFQKPRTKRPKQRQKEEKLKEIYDNMTQKSTKETLQDFVFAQIDTIEYVCE